MTIVTDNVRMGCNKGMGKALVGALASGLGPQITYTNATPDDILTGQNGSDIVWDAVASELYMVEAQGGSEWIHLGSVS